MKYLTSTNRLSFLKKLFLTGFCIFLLFPVIAQREKGESLITQDQIRKITGLVKPLTDQLGKQLNSDETYKAYVQDLTEVNNTKSFEEKKSLGVECRFWRQ